MIMGGMFGAMVGVVSDVAEHGAQQKAYEQNTGALLKLRLQEQADAVDSQRRGSILAGQQRMRGSALVAKQRVAYANSGVDATVGTPTDTAASSLAFNEFDALTIENNAAREALGHTRTAQNIETKRAQLKAQSDAADVALGIKFAGRVAQFAGGAQSDFGNTPSSSQTSIDTAFNGY